MTSLFALIFTIIIAGYLWYAFSIIYHLIRFGVGKQPKVLSLVFFIGSFTMFAAALINYSGIDWQEIIRLIFK